MARTSRKEIEQLFKVFLNAYGLRAARDIHDVGGYALDYYAHGGGYTIVCVTKGGGVHKKFTQRRYSPQEFATALDFAISVKQELHAHSYTENPSRKDFEAAARVIAALHVDEVTRHAIAVAFAEMFAGTNPRFDRERFIRASGVDLERHVETMKKAFRGNPHHKHERRSYPGATYRVEVWEERDRLHVALWRSWKGNDDMVADWWDDDARQMFEDGFFTSGRGLESSVIEYARSVGIIN